MYQQKGAAFVTALCDPRVAATVLMTAQWRLHRLHPMKISHMAV
jgi:hypothetical protein